MTDRLNKTSICSIVFLDIIDYSKKPVSEQIDDKTFFNELINEAIQNVAPNDRIILDTGDGAAITLMGAPEEALFIALTIRDGILQHNKDNPLPLLVRIGINLGSIRVMKDLNDRPNIIGDGINVAQRIMSFAEANQILVSRSYYEVTSRLTKEITSLFSYSGIKQDKHIREHEVYVIKSRDEEAAIPQPEPDFYTVGGMKFHGRKFVTSHFAPIMVAAFCLALGAWYLLVLRPIPSGKDLATEEVPAISSTKVLPATIKPVAVEGKGAQAVTPVIQQIKTEPKADNTSAKIATDGATKKLSEKPSENTTEKSSAKSTEKPMVKKSVPKKTSPKKEVAVTHHNNSDATAKTEAESHKPSTSTAPIVKHVCTQAEIAMNQCR
ncbi:MAG TPA: adenylate/guanylate cyclase domain-containing protein [Methylotenera sp.]|nr:adenylate/guanylate cyclase domain-containing protein [Methylotenera sp.]